MWNRRTAGAWILILALLSFPCRAIGEDEEGCLICHRLGLRKATVDGGGELRVSDSAAGPHKALYCSDCHVDAKSAPHPVSPGPAGCIGECHSASAGSAESHRTASFGGLIEPHRKLAAPRAPCLLCHRAEDRLANRGEIGSRCSGCHAGMRESVATGPHARVEGKSGEGMCADCHLAHKTPAKSPPNPSVGNANCGGKGCHAGLSDGMKRLGGHGKKAGSAGIGNKAAAGGFFIALVALGALSGRMLRGNGRGKGASR